jgi:hypothetical protein
MMAGQLTFVVYFCLTVPFMLYWMRLLVKLRNVQPIKARGPWLIFSVDALLIFYIMMLTIKQLLGNDFPCMLTNWGAALGPVILFNSYMWRSWTLYFNYELAEHRKNEKRIGMDPQTKRKSVVLSNQPSKEYSDWFIRHKDWNTGSFLTRVFGTTTTLLLLPVGIVTTNDKDIVNGDDGDDCAATTVFGIVSGYTLLFMVLFGVFGYKLRNVHDNFVIKRELKWTALLCVLALIPWAVFNSVAEDVNKETFPVSTMCLLLCFTGMFIFSTVIPVRMAIKNEGNSGDWEEIDLPENMDTLEKLLASKAGFKNFSDFLISEWNVENVLFWKAIDEYRTLKAALIENDSDHTMMQLVQEAQNIYAKYIVEDSPFQVNISATRRMNVSHTIKRLFHMAASQGDVAMLERLRSTGTSKTGEVLTIKSTCPTIFDHAQRDIYKLMEHDSLRRYFASSYYIKMQENMRSRMIAADVHKDFGFEGMQLSA